MLNLTEFVSGLFGGVFGTILCYPPDTIKTRLQVGITGKELFSGNLYKGVFSPMIGVAIEKSTLFFAYDMMKQHTSLNEFQRGTVSGLITTLIVTPPERLKIKSQLNNISTVDAFKTIIKHDGLHSLYRGWSATLGREVPGYGVYFYTYEKLKPSDPIKTVMQDKNVDINKAIECIYQKGGIKGFYKGFSWAILRAGILHGGVILGYESCKKFI